MERNRPFILFLVCSLSVHGGALAALATLARTSPRSASAIPPPTELVLFEVEPPKPAEVPPERAKPIVRPAPKALVLRKRAPVEEEPPPPRERATDRPSPVQVGVSESSTTPAGAVAAPVGNTLAGANPIRAPSPASVGAIAGLGYVPISQVDSQPELASDFVIPYPENVRQQGIEGLVQLSLWIDASGNVTRVRILSGPGHGLNELAQEAARRLKFRPATKKGKPVATELTYRYRFELL